MQKPTFKNKKHKRKQAFTLIELLIVIAIIGILFIVLVSKVDFATDKAKATGVQTDFRSFQLAFETVSRENSGFNTFGWDTGDANQDGVRNSYDEGDNGAGGGTAKNGIQDGTEIFTGHKVYAETFTKVFSLKKNGTGSYDRDALNRLEAAINANLDPKLHITIATDGTITMANGAQDPWNKEYHGWYISNAENDGKDRGAIVMYSDGANNEFGSEHSISNGVVSISIPGNNRNGKDDYGMAVVYTYTNGFGEIKTTTSGFSNNLTTTPGNGVVNNGGNGNGGGNVDGDVQTPENETFLAGATFTDGVTLTWDELMLPANGEKYGYDASAISNDVIGMSAFEECETLVSISIADTVTKIDEYAFSVYEGESKLNKVLFSPNSQLISIEWAAFCGCTKLKNISLPATLEVLNGACFDDSGIESLTIPKNVSYIYDNICYGCDNLSSLLVEDGNTVYHSQNNCIIDTYEKTLIQGCKTSIIPDDGSVIYIGYGAFYGISTLTNISIPNTILDIGDNAFCESGLTSITISDSVISIQNYAFAYCDNLKTLNVGKSLSYLGMHGVFERAGIESIVVDVNNSKYHSENNCMIETATETLVLGCKNSIIPTDGSVRVIGANAFAYVDINAIDLPSCVYEIGVGAFRYSTLEYINIQEDSSLSMIEDYAFESSKIKSIFLPKRIRNIETGAFEYCESLENVYWDGIGTDMTTVLWAWIKGWGFGTGKDLVITFNGTKTQWNRQVSLAPGWKNPGNESVSSVTVIFNDGTITYN